MIKTRRFFVQLAPALIGIFSLLLVVTQVTGSYYSDEYCTVIDFEDNNKEPSEETKPLNLLKDYNLSREGLLSLQRNFILNSVKYRRFAVEHALEVFIEVVTPPPEA